MKFCAGPTRIVCHFGLNRVYAKFPDGMILSRPRSDSKWEDARILYRAWFRMLTGIDDWRITLKECR